MLLDDVGNAWRQDDREPTSADVPAQFTERVRIDGASRVHYLDPWLGALRAHHHCRCHTVAEQATRHDVCHRGIPALQRQRAQLYRDEQRNVAGMTLEI